MENTEKEILKKFFETDFFQNNILPQDVIFAFLGGSRLLNLATQNSDYDVIIILNKKENEITFNGKTINFIYKNIKINYLLLSINKYAGVFDSSYYNFPLALSKNAIISENDILYKNSKYNYLIDYLINDIDFKNYLQKVGYYAASFDVQSLDKLEQSLFEKKRYIKFNKYYYNVYFAITLFKKINFDKKLALKIKLCQELSDKEYFYLCQLLYDYFIDLYEHPFDVIYAAKTKNDELYAMANKKK